jgi:hypothetical protein
METDNFISIGAYTRRGALVLAVACISDSYSRAGIHGSPSLGNNS